MCGWPGRLNYPATPREGGGHFRRAPGRSEQHCLHPAVGESLDYGAYHGSLSRAGISVEQEDVACAMAAYEVGEGVDEDKLLWKGLEWERGQGSG